MPPPQLKPQILSWEANAPYDRYDSLLEIPDGSDARQNAWLTLQLRVHLRFVDSRQPHPPLTVYQDGKWYARDVNGYLFPLIDWRPHLIERFLREYAELAEKTWNWQFVLITPKHYGGLDYYCMKRSIVVRPNVLCLFRMSLMSATGEALDTSPAAGPMRAGPPHRTINVVNLNYATGTVHLAPGVDATDDHQATRHFNYIDGKSFRSDALNYDDADLFRPAWLQKEENVLSNTVGHEVGHALGQCHIMGLKGDPQYAFEGAHANDRAAYGHGSANKLDEWNIMGAGNRVYLINAVSWRERIALHTGRPAADWLATGLMNTSTRARWAGSPAPRAW